MRLDALGAFLVFFVWLAYIVVAPTISRMDQIAIFSVTGVGGINAAEIGLVLTYASAHTTLSLSDFADSFQPNSHNCLGG